MLKRLLNVRTVPVALLGFAILAYGVLLPSLGFYWDDWPMVWFAHTLGSAGYQEVFSGDRPFLAGIYILTTSILKLVPIQWQILGLLSRWVTGWALWWTLRKFWPERTEAVTWIAILFTVYPGFKQQPISVVYSNGFFLLAFYILSFGFMIEAIHKPNRFWLYTILGLISWSLCTFSTEYYVGLEAIRPIMIWMVLSEKGGPVKSRIRDTIKYWWYYIIFLIVFLIWRVLIFGFPTYKPDLVGNLASSLGKSLLTLVSQIFNDILTTGWVAWAETFRIPRIDDFSVRSNVLFWIIVLVALALTGLYLTFAQLANQERSQDTQSRPQWGRQAVLFSLAWLFFAGWPFWIINLSVELQFPWDRFSLSFMIGACILVVALIEWIIRTRAQKVVILTLVIAFAIGANLQTANTYRREWTTQKDLFWQMTWRAPGLKKGTLVITKSFPLKYYSDNSLTAPLNWTYAPDNHSTDLPYFLAYTEVRLGHSIPELKENLQVDQVYRNASYHGSTSNALTMFYSPPGCLRVIDPEYDQDLAIFPKDYKSLLTLSHPDQIITNPDKPATPPQGIFGNEPEHTWCYYFEKAELARQMGDWDQVMTLADEAFSKGYSAAEPSELLVFIDGYAQNGRWDRAIDIVNLAYSQSNALQSKLCTTLKGYQQTGLITNEGRSLVDSKLKQMGCQ